MNEEQAKDKKKNDELLYVFFSFSKSIVLSMCDYYDKKITFDIMMMNSYEYKCVQQSMYMLE